jgi:RND superfamily putative drug exporter
MTPRRRSNGPGREDDPTGSAAGGARPGLLERLGGFCVRHRRLVGLVWLVVLVVVGTIGAAAEHDLSNKFDIPGTGSQDAYNLLDARFGSQNDASTTLVFSVPKGHTVDEQADAVAATVVAVAKLPHVASVADPLTSNPTEVLTTIAGTLPEPDSQAVLDVADDLPPTVSADGRVAFTTISYDRTIQRLMDRYPVQSDAHPLDYPNPFGQLQRALDATAAPGLTVSVGGIVADTWNQPVSWWASHADEVGLALGAVLLLVAFGSVFGMALPIATALFGAGTASGLVFLLAKYVTVSSAVPPVTLMISLGVGLDYSLLIVTRYRQFVRAGVDPHAAVGKALGTAGRATVFAGITVCIAMLGLVLVPLPLVQVMGLGAAIGVAVTVLAAMTFLPALLGMIGPRIDSVRIPFFGRDRGTPPEQTFWGRFANHVSGHPWLFTVAGTIVLLVIAAPFLRIQFGMPDDSSLPRSLSQRTAFEQTTRAFGPGVNGPLVVAVALPEKAPVGYLTALTDLSKINDAVGALQPSGTVRGVKYSVGPIPNDVEKTTAVVYEITPTSAPDAAATADLVARLRADLATATAGTPYRAYVGGATATLIDLTDVVTTWLPWVVGAVVLGAFVLLLVVFRSVPVALKAAVMNLLSIAAAYGVVVAVFQWGWAKGLVGLDQTVPIVSFVPLIMFVILFGLSMDYEVFLMSRIHEEWVATQDTRSSVVLGVANTARVITTAAAIMIVVFGSFVANANPTVKLIGFGMAVAVLIDSTLLRMILVPAVMELLGKFAWWFPRWLGWLPHLDLGESSDEEIVGMADAVAPLPSSPSPPSSDT